MSTSRVVRVWLLGGSILALVALLVHASSHREAPFITEYPKVDGTDFYMFRSYEPGRESFITLIANYLPLQDAYGGPNYFFLDPEALYEIHLDNNGNGQEDITFQFRFQNTLRSLAVPVGEGGDVRMVPVPLINIGAIGVGGNPADRANLNIQETYTVTIVRGDRRQGTAQAVTNATATAVVAAGNSTFVKPVDNIGQKSIPDYDAYARAHIYDITIPGCNATGSRVFVGQRREPFFFNLGEGFDLINVPNPVGEEFAAARRNIIDDKNITALILEVPIACLTAGAEPVIGGWTTASLRQARVLNPTPSTDAAEQGPTVEGGAWTQVSRLGHPVVNEVVIGLPDKDRFNASAPVNDTQFLEYVTHPTFPELVEILFGAAGVQAPNFFPRNDLVATFLTGINTTATGNLNQPNNVQPAEILRLNTSISPTPAAAQSRLGVIAGDNAGFPNGRRPGDDVIDIVLRVAMGRLLSLGLFGTPAQAPSGTLDFTDGAFGDASSFDSTFPYLTTPLPGSPIEASEP